jgi:hypothetical protein
LDVAQCVFSPDGTKFGLYNNQEDFQVFDFDRCSGILTNYRQVYINDSMVCAGASFSNNSKYLYGSSGVYLYQIDATSNQPDTTLHTVAVWDSTFSPSPPFAALFFTQQLASDGKIYITTGNGTLTMHTIDSPDSMGVACNVLQHNIALPSYNLTNPNHPNYNLGPLIGSGCDTLTSINEEYINPTLTLQAHPNPVGGAPVTISYKLAPNQPGKLQIIDLAGKVVFTQVLPPWSSTQKVSLEGLSSGVYVMQLLSGGIKTQIKLIKQ